MKYLKILLISLCLLLIVHNFVYANESVEWLSVEEGSLFEPEITDAILNLPERVVRKIQRQDLNGDGVRIQILNDFDYLEEKYNQSYYGLYDVKEGVIYICSCRYNHLDYEENLDMVIGILLHEIGHRFDVASFYPSYTEEFIEIYEEEKDDFRNADMSLIYYGLEDYAVSNSHEFFANIFAEYLLYPEEIKYTCPKSYAKIEQMVYP